MFIFAEIDIRETLMFRKGKESIMAGNGKKHGFTHTLTFKVLCGFVVLFVLGMIYNFIVAENSDISEEEKEVEEQRKAAQDTLDIVGNYLWPDMKPRTEDLLSDEEKAKTEADKKANEAAQKKAAQGEQGSQDINMPKVNLPPVPTPAADPVPGVAPVATPKATKPGVSIPSGPTIEKLEAPKVEKIEQ